MSSFCNLSLYSISNFEQVNGGMLWSRTLAVCPDLISSTNCFVSDKAINGLLLYSSCFAILPWDSLPIKKSDHVFNAEYLKKSSNPERACSLTFLSSSGNTLGLNSTRNLLSSASDILGVRFLLSILNNRTSDDFLYISFDLWRSIISYNFSINSVFCSSVNPLTPKNW